MNNKLGPYTILAGIWLFTLVVLFRPEIHGCDTIAYYSWVRSPVIQGSFEMSDEFEQFGQLEERKTSPVTGYCLNEWAVGSAALWLPFFLIGHLVALCIQAAGLPIAADGFSWPYLAFTSLGSALYALTGLILLFRLCRDFARSYEAQLAVITAWLATPLVFYMSAHPLMSHANDFFVNVVYFYRWARDDRSTWRSRFLLGLVGGLAMCVRPQNATLLVWPAIEEVIGQIRDHGRGVPAAAGRLVALVVGGLAGFTPQIVAWKIVFGQWMMINPYGVTQAGTFDLLSPHFIEVLFSTNRGLFVWTPVAVVALWGLARHLPRYKPSWALFLGANFLLQVYVVGSWSQWSGAAAFGQRFLVNSVPAFCLGLAALYTSGFFRRSQIVPAVFSTIFIGWNLILLARYGLADVARLGPVNPEELWLGQFTFLLRVSDRAGELLRAIAREVP